MKPYIESIKVTDLKIGDFVVSGNEVMEAEMYEIETLTRDEDRTYINGNRWGVKHMAFGIASEVPAYKQVLRFK